ncbi:MAG: glycosyltransferase family 2 protein [Bacteroidia bacterium]
MKTAVVILNYNTRKLLDELLPIVIAHSQHAARIIVADNCSPDDSVQLIKTKYPQVELIVNESNGGFAKGYNDCLKYVNAEYILLLNSDVEVTENWIEPLINILDNDSTVAGVQPKIKAYQNKKNFEFAGASGGFIDKYGFPFCRGRIFDSLETDNGQYNDSREVFWTTGACMLIRKKIFDEHRGFDEDFFAHMEEIDLCWRIQNAGYRLMVEPASIVYHIGGGTLDAASPQKTFYNFRNNLLMLHKNLPSSKLYYILFIKLILDGIAALRFLAINGVPHFMAVFNAHIYFYNNLKHRNQIRKSAQEKAVRYYEKNIYKGSLVVQYFLMKRKIFSELKNKF